MLASGKWQTYCKLIRASAYLEVVYNFENRDGLVEELEDVAGHPTEKEDIVS